MKKFTALKGNGSQIITVVAENEKDAKDIIREQLRRRRRIEFFEAWVIGGFQVKEGTIVRGDHYGSINPELLKEQHDDECDCVTCLARRERGGLDYDPTNDDEEFEEHERQILRDRELEEKERANVKSKPYGFKVETIREALNGGMAFYLDTYLGRLKMSGIDARGDMATTGSSFTQRSWAICSTQVDRWYRQTL